MDCLKLFKEVVSLKDGRDLILSHFTQPFAVLFAGIEKQMRGSVNHVSTVGGLEEEIGNSCISLVDALCREELASSIPATLCCKAVVACDIFPMLVILSTTSKTKDLAEFIARRQRSIYEAVMTLAARSDSSKPSSARKNSPRESSSVCETDLLKLDQTSLLELQKFAVTALEGMDSEEAQTLRDGLDAVKDWPFWLSRQSSIEESCESPLGFAVTGRVQGNSPANLAEVLMEAGADVNSRNSRGRTPLLVALANASPLAVVESLLLNKADPNAFDADFHGSLYHLLFPTFCMQNTLASFERDEGEKKESDMQQRNVDELIQKVDLLLHYGLDVNICDNQSKCGLHHILLEENQDLVVTIGQKLLTSDLDLDSGDTYGQTSLHLAIKRNHPRFALQLLNHGANPNLRDCSGNLPLHYIHECSAEGTEELAKALLTHGEGRVLAACSISQLHSDMTGLERKRARVKHVLKQGHAELLGGNRCGICNQVESKNSLVTLRNDDGLSATHLLVKKCCAANCPDEVLERSQRVLSALLAYVKEEVDHLTIQRESPLQLACTISPCNQNYQAKTVKLLVEHGANINSSHSKFFPLLHAAAYTPHLVKEMTSEYSLLLDNAEFLSLMAWNGNSDLLAKLIALCGDFKDNHPINTEGDIDICSNFNPPLPKEAMGPPIIAAASKGNWHIIELLCKVTGGQVNVQRTWDGQTALHVAAAQGDIKSVEILLKAGADVDVKDSKKETACIKAIRESQLSVAQVLLQKEFEKGGQSSDSMQQARQVAAFRHFVLTVACSPRQQDSLQILELLSSL